MHIDLTQLYQLEIEDANASENAILSQSPAKKFMKRPPFTAQREPSPDPETSELAGEGDALELESPVSDVLEQAADEISSLPTDSLPSSSADA